MRRLVPRGPSSPLRLVSCGSHPWHNTASTGDGRLARDERRLRCGCELFPAPTCAAAPAPRAARPGPSATRLRCFLRVGKVRFDAPRIAPGALVARERGAVRRDGVRLEVELGLEDDKLLLEAGGVRAEEVDRLVVLFLWIVCRGQQGSRTTGRETRRTSLL